LNFRALIVPVFSAVIICIIAFIAIVRIAADEQDKLILQKEKELLQHGLTFFHRNLKTLANDNAWWDDSVQNLHKKEDVGWAANTLGDSVNNIDNLDGVIVIRPDGSILYDYSIHKGINATNVVARLNPILTAFHKSKNLVRQSGFLNAGNTIVAYGISMVRPGNSSNVNTAPSEQMPLVIFLAALTNERIKHIGAKSTFAEISIINKPCTQTGQARVIDPTGHQVATICWKSAAAGTQLAMDLLVPSIGLLVLIISALIYFTIQAIRVVEELEKANKSKSAFLASMSHEIRTPLNSILGFTELISMELYGKVSGKKNKEYLRLIQGSGHHLLSVINDILDLSKLESGKFVVYAEKIEPAGIVAACIKLIEPTANDNHIIVTQECETCNIYSDERILRQILLNLLSNALKFTKKGGNVHVQGKRQEQHYEISVQDTGIGMTAEQINVAMSNFGQIENEYERTHSGTGLGLPLVQRFTTLLEGRLSIQSAPSQGTTITLLFPYSIKRKHL